MKNLGICVFLSTITTITTACYGQQTATTTPTVPAPTPFQIVSQASDSQVWQRTVWELAPSGQAIPKTQSYVECASGLNFKNASGQWQPSIEKISILPDGSGAATNAPTRAYFPADIYNGTIKLVTPEGIQLQGQPIGLSFSDGTNSALIAVLTNSVGELVSSNEIIYPNAFLGISADIAYVFHKSGLEQDIVIHSQLPAPEQYSLNSADPALTVQLLTEFIDPPEPAQSVGAMNPENGIQDTTLSWGSMRMTHGRAFLTGTNAESQEISVSKSWIQVDGRSVLVEQAPFKNVAPQLSALPPAHAAVKGRSSGLRKLSSKRLLPPRHLAQATTSRLRLAGADLQEKTGFIWDYVTVSSSSTNWVFQGNETYYISGPFYLYLKTTFEGGVIKFNTNGLIEIDESGSIDCQCGPYRPCAFTSWKDGSIGLPVGSGSPNFQDVSCFLDLQTTNNVELHDLRFCYAKEAIKQDSEADVTLRNCQFEDVAEPIYGYNLAIYNVLFGDSSDEMYGITNHGYAQIYPLNSLVAENVTADSGYALIEDDNDIVPALTNCLITSEPIYSPTHGSAPDPASNSVVWLLSLSAPVYESMNGGNYYLTNGSPYRDFGTANIDATLLSDLQQKTTYAPILYNGVTFSTNATFTPWAPRDTNSLPDIGYAYDPLDYIFESSCQVYSNMTFTAGTAAAWTTGEGIQLENKVTVNFAGLATLPDYWVRANTVQEADPNGTYLSGGLVSEYSSSLTSAPTAESSFTHFSMLAGYGNPFRDDGGQLNINIDNSEFWNTGEGGYTIGLNLTNCLFYRTYIGVLPSGPAAFSMQNCTVYGGQIFTSHSSSWPATFVNCSFDAGVDLSGVNSVTYANYNAFSTNSSRFPTLGTNDIIVTNSFNWQTNWFGNFYLPTNSPLLYQGSTNANDLGLYHFTTQTNQIPDGNNRVTIGYHYVATDTNGAPLDSNGDGIPDYLEDANGDGLVDDGETNWALAILTQPVSQIAVPGTNANFYVGADGIAPISYQWYFNGTNIAWATNSTLILTNVQSVDEGLYFAVVSNFSGTLTSSVVALEPGGLIGWWPGEGNAKDNAGPDNGNLMDNSFTNGVIGQAFQFDGTNGYILVPDSPILKPTNLTLEAWVRFSSLESFVNGNTPTVPDVQTIVEKPNISLPSSSWQRAFYIDGYALFKAQGTGGNDNFEFGVTGPNGTNEVYAIDSAVSIQTNVWYFVAAVRGSNYIQLYVNGQLGDQESVGFDQGYGTAPLYFGSTGEPVWADQKLEGSLDEVSLYDRALSSNEIQETYNAELSGIRNCFVPPVIVTQPSSQSATAGTTATLLVAAAGSPPLGYQWSFNGANIAGATNATLTLPGVQNTNAGNYSVVVANNQGTVTSSNAVLAVDTCFPSLDVALVIDDSCYTTNFLDDGNMEISADRIAATNFLQGLNFASDQAALFSFNSTVTTNQTLTNSSPDLLNAVGSLPNGVPETFPVMGNALQIAQSELAGPRHHSDALPVMVFVSGTDPTDINFSDDPTMYYHGPDIPDTLDLVLGAATLAKASGTRLITIALGPDADTNFMAQMATSPSDTYYATNLSQLTNDFNLIAASICRGTNQSPMNAPVVQIISPTNQTFNAESNVIITATVTNWSYSAPVTWVEFFVGTNLLGGTNNPLIGSAIVATNSTDTNVFKMGWFPQNAGTYVATAEAVGTNGSGSWSSWSQSVTNSINGLPTVTITNPINGANLGSVYASMSVPVTAAVTLAGPSVTNVSYYANGVLIGIGTNLSSSYQISWTNITPGVYALSATATDTKGATGISSNVLVVVEPPNQAPFVYAGPNQVTNLPSTQLNGLVSDDGLPSNYLAVTWSLISGPIGGTANISNVNQTATMVKFNTNGIYEFQLLATDGQSNSRSLVWVTVLETNLPPVVSAPPVQTAIWPQPQTANTTNISWISPSWITFTDAPSIDNDIQPPTPILTYNAVSNCLMTDAEDNSGEYYCLYFDTNFDPTYNLGPYGLGTYYSGFSGPLASVQNTNGGFSVGDNFFATAEGVIMRVKPDGETVGTSSYTDLDGNIQSNAWVVVGPEANSPSGEGYFATFWVDQTGAWGGDLLGLCEDGNIYRINYSGQATWVAQLPTESTGGGVMTVVPNNLRQYGPWAGRLLAEVLDANLYAIDTNGFMVKYHIPSASVLVGEPVPQNENLFDCLAYGQGTPDTFESVPASQLSGMTGDMLLMGSPAAVLQRFHWNGSAFDIHQLGAEFEVLGSELNVLHFVYCPLGVTNIPNTEFRLQASVSDDGELFSPTSNLWVEVSGPGSVEFEDPTLTNTVAQFSAPGDYILRFSAYDGQFTTFTNVQVNVVYDSVPTVNAGTNQIIPGTNTTLNCLVQDSGLSSGQLSVTWSVMSSPSGVGVDLDWTNQVIDSTDDLLTNQVSFPIPGTYTLEVTASDGTSSSSARVTITVESSCLTLSPAFGWPTLTNTPFTVTATLVDSNSVPITNAAIQFSVSDFLNETSYTNWSTNTDSNGMAPFTYTSASQRGDLITATATVAGQPYQASIQKEWASAIGCDSVLTGGVWTSTSVSMPAANSASGGPEPHNADYYIFQGSVGATATVSISNSLDSSASSLDFVVRDPSNNVVAVFDNETEMPDAVGYGQMTFPMALPGNYLIEVISTAWLNGGGGGPSYGLALSCNDDTNVYVAGAPPQMQLLYNGTNYTSGETIVFPQTTPSYYTNISLVISNSGASDLFIQDIDETNAQYVGDFIVTNGSIAIDLTIPPGESTNIDVIFNPSTNNGTTLGQLAFYGNIPNGECYMVYLSGSAFTTGAPPAVIITSPRSFSSFYASATIPFTAVVSPGVTNVASVAFEDITTNGSALIGAASPASSTNEWQFTWSDAVTGNYTIAAVVTDAAGRMTTSPPIYITINPISPTNIPPILTNITSSVQANSVNNVLNPLAYAHDLNGNPMTIVAISQPLNGNATIINNGAEITYTPKTDYSSQTIGGVLQPFDEFSYQVSDEHGGLSTAQITMLVYPEVPPIVTITNPPANYSTNAGSVLPINAVITNIPATNIAKVDFYVNNEFIGEVTNGTNGSYILNWTAVSVDGAQEKITAVATDILGEEGTSAPRLVTLTFPPGALTGALDYFVGLSGTNFLDPDASSLPTIRDGVFPLYGRATNADTSITWSLGVYSSDGSTLLRNLVSGSTSPVGTADNSGLLVSNCDLTTLQNGVYDLRLTVIGGGATNIDQPFILESNLKIGEFSFSQQDLVIPVNGIPLTVTRTYNSLNPDEGAFGYGWSYSLSDMDVSIDETRETEGSGPDAYSIRTGGGRDVTLTLPNGQRTTFYYDPTEDGYGGTYPHWTSQPGVVATLEPGPFSATVEVGIEEIEGGQPYWQDPLTYSPVSDAAYDFPSFILTMGNGTKYYINRQDERTHGMSGFDVHAWGAPYLAKITDLNSNTITINSNSIVSTTSGGATSEVLFQRNNLGLISAISDPAGISGGETNGPPAMLYQYDSTGNLLNVLRLTDRSGAGTYVTNTFTYTNANFPHYITGVINADGTQIAKTVCNDSGQIIEIDDAYGNKTYYVHELTNNSEMVIDPLGNTNTSVYDTTGNVIETVDALGHTNSFAYDPSGYLTNSVDALGNATTYVNDQYGNVLSVTVPYPPGANPAAYTTAFTFDQYADQTSVTLPTGGMVTNIYDADGNFLGSYDEQSNLISFTTYNSVGLPATDGDQFGTNYYGYDSGGNMTSFTNSLGGVTASGYDANGNLTNMVDSGGTSTIGYDAMNRQTSADCGNGITANYNYTEDDSDWSSVSGPTLGNMQRQLDDLGRLSGWNTPNGSNPGFVYDSDGRLQYETNSIGVVVQSVYDGAGRLVASTNLATGGWAAYGYDADGRKIAETNVYGQVTTYGYWPSGSLMAMTNAAGSYWLYSDAAGACSACGNSGSVTDILSRVTVTVTSPHDLPLQTIRLAYPGAIGADAVTNSITYPQGLTTPDQDAGDYPASETDEGGRTRYYAYTPVGQLWQATDLSGAVWWTNEYDVASGNLTNVLSPMGESLDYTYDDLNNVAAMRFADGNKLTNYYNSANRLSGVRLPTGVCLTNLYDFAGRLTNHSSTIGETASFDYNGNDAITVMTDNTGSTTNYYDSGGRLWGIDYPSGAGVRYTLDLLDRIVAITNWVSAGGQVYITHYQYDAIGNITNIIDPFNGQTSFTYDQVGRRTQRVLPNGIVTTWQYDWKDQVTNIVHRTGATVLASAAYIRAQGGEPLQVTREDGSYVVLGYDAALRLTNEIYYNSTDLPQTTNSYGYDADGNRILFAQGGTVLTNGVSPGYQITAIKNARNGSTVESYAFDQGGRETTIARNGATLNLGYNSSDQVIAVTNGSSWVTYLHDAEGRRTVSADSTGIVRRFLVAPTAAGGLERPHLIANGSETLQAGYVYCGDEPVMNYTSSGTATYYLEDGMGSVIGLAPASGPSTSNTTRLFYDGFGNSRATNGPAPIMSAGAGGDFRFQGAWLEAGSGLYNMRAREYDATTGRFTSRDQVLGDLSEPETVHPYNFATENPYVYMDPSGDDFTLVSISVSETIDKTLDSLADVVIAQARQRLESDLFQAASQVIINQLGNIYPPLGSMWRALNNSDYANAGRNFENAFKRKICDAIDGNGQLSRILWFYPGINRNGQARFNGVNCPRLSAPRLQAGLSYPDFLISEYAPTAVSGDRRPGDSIVIGDVKLSGNSLYNQYVREGPENKIGQFNSMVNYAGKYTETRTVLFLSVFSGNKSKLRQVQGLLGVEGLEKGVVVVVVAALQNKNFND